MALIDRDALIECMDDRPLNWCNTDSELQEVNDYDRFMQIIENQPEIDAIPVIHARWIVLDECANEGVYCSECHKKVYRIDYAWSKKPIKQKSNYCPNCGAKMDGKEQA